MNTQTNELEVIPPSALEAITRGEIDTQIRTAKQFPRSMKSFIQRATDMATSHVDIAESFIYVRPVGKKDGKMQYAEGLSVRAAEIIGATYGNLRVGSMIIEQTDRHVVTRGFAHDLESNFASTSENKEPTVTKDGKPFSEAMRSVIAKASLAKARRDATFQVVPKALCRPIETAARALIAGDAKSLDERRASAVSYLQRLKIDMGRIWSALGIKGEEEITSEILLTLTGIRNAIRDGDTTIDDAFPVPGEKGGKAAIGRVEKPAAAASPSDLTATGVVLGGLLKQAAKIGADEKQLLKVLIEMRLIEPSDKLETLTPEQLTKIEEQWIGEGGVESRLTGN